MKIFRMVQRSLKNKLIISHITAIIIVTLLVEIIIYAIAVSIQLKDARAFELQMVNQISNSIDNIILSFSRVFNHVTMNSELQTTLKTDTTDSNDRFLSYKLDNQLQSISVGQTIFINELDDLYLFDNDILRVYFSRYYPDYGDNVSALEPDVKQYNLNGSVTWRTDGKTVYFDRAILEINTNKGIGYLTMTMHKKIIQDTINSVRSNPNRFIIVTDELDNVIVHNYQKNPDMLKEILYSAREVGNNSDRVQRSDYLKESLVTIYQSEYSKWKVYSFIAMNELTRGPSIIAQWIFFVVGIIGCIIGLIISLLSSGKMVKPLNALTYLMDEVEKENFNVRIHIDSKDELRRLGDSFNNMVEKIKTLINKVYYEELKLKEAEIKALQAQINPHFLYNTLDCINWLAEFGKTEEIRSVTIALANLMKTSANDRRKLVTVAEEFENINSYLTIYKITLQEKFQYCIDIDEQMLEFRIPKLILQPLVENAIIHGIKKKIGQGSIHLKGFLDGNRIVFKIFDDGVGISKDRLKGIWELPVKDDRTVGGMGSGMRNVSERIKLIYGQEYGIDIHSSEGIGTMIEVNIPAEEKLEGFNV